MRFSQKAIDEFKAIYRKEFKKDVTDDEAQGMGTRLVTLLRILLQPLPGDCPDAARKASKDP